MDVTDILSNTLNNLTIIPHPTPPDNADPDSQTQPTASSSVPLKTFPRYSALPSELRLKILRHTLPPPAILRLKCHILISDPSFGLYLTFSISRTGYTHGGDAFQPIPHPGEIATELKVTRMTTLLSTTKEIRSFYISHYPIVLPSGPNGKGQIRLAKSETLCMDIFRKVIINRDFSRAIQSNYRLQEFWAQIENLAIPATTFMRPDFESYETLLGVVGKCTGLKTLRAVMWDEFRGGEGGDMAVESILRYFEGFLEKFKERLEEYSGAELEGGEVRRGTVDVKILEI
ncbi:hypothetical protein BKA64DRAFT_641751 [Cadophora sp. MPI-SDFR-AT-0126]|nr:hypothetical protein BKA64DRAFT_641751 [Leotiomycetes sp. MPI-SDFR-AT-0126]